MKSFIEFVTTDLDEAAKGVVDKNFGKPAKESKSGFKQGQRVAHYRGMGKTLHGDVVNPDVVSGGKRVLWLSSRTVMNSFPTAS